MTVSQHGELFGQPRFLQRDADPLADLVVGPAPLQAQHFAPRRRSACQQPLEDFDRGGLAGPVRAEQAEALAAARPPVEPAHGLDRRLAVVSLDEVRALNG